MRQQSHAESAEIRPSEERGFYGWVRNGMRLYDALAADFPLYGGDRSDGPVTIETFPQAVACHLARRLVSAKPKGQVRRAILADAGIDETRLRHIDYVDAALCALAAQAFAARRFLEFGRRDAGYIIVPRS